MIKKEWEKPELEILEINLTMGNGLGKGHCNPNHNPNPKGIDNGEGHSKYDGQCGFES